MPIELPSKTMAQSIFLQLRQDILQCRLRPGDRLRLDALRETYGVGMSPLREALSRLSSINLVVAEEQRGFSVAQICTADLLGLTKSRVWVETTALRFAIATGDRNWEAEIVAAAHRLGDGPSYLVVDGVRVINEVWQTHHRAFHAALVSVATSPHILGFRDHLYDLSDRYRRVSGSLARSGRASAAEHRALMEATLARDAEAAVEVMTDHLVGTTRLILENDPDQSADAARLIGDLLRDIRFGLHGGAVAPLAGVAARPLQVAREASGAG